jgi:hypothetical protein
MRSTLDSTAIAHFEDVVVEEVLPKRKCHQPLQLSANSRGGDACQVSRSVSLTAADLACFFRLRIACQELHLIASIPPMLPPMLPASTA